MWFMQYHVDVEQYVLLRLVDLLRLNTKVIYLIKELGLL